MVEEGPREWSPGRKRGEVKIKVLANLGDEHPLDYGGYVIYRVRDPKGKGAAANWIQAEWWAEPMETDRDNSEKDRYDVYRWQIEGDAAKDLNWVENWKEIGEYSGMPNILTLARSGSVIDRAHVYEAVGQYHGFENLDSYPEQFTRKEMEERWPEFA